MAFYAAALLVDVAFVAGTFWGMPRDAWSVFFVLIQKCLLPLALFVVVMYIGVLDLSLIHIYFRHNSSTFHPECR